MWQFPWRYKESFMVATGLLACGIALDILSPASIPPLVFPYNVVVGINVVFLMVVLYWYRRNHPVVVWLSSVPAALSAITLFSVLGLVMGFVPQQAAGTGGASYSGFNHLLSSWQYVLAELYFFLTLGMVTIRRSIPFSFKNTGFLLNHAGLLLVVMGMALGVGDKQKVSVRLTENSVEWRGINEKNQIVQLPIAMTLKSFSIEDYNPSIYFVNNETLEVIEEKRHKQQFLVEKGARFESLGMTVRVVDFLPDAAIFDTTFVNFKSKGSVPAALVEVTDMQGRTTRGWISCGNYISPAIMARVNRTMSVALAKPHPKKYSSHLVIQTADGLRVDTTIVVNKPFKINGWKIYQTGFDETKGKWSDVSFVELVTDPWLPIIYTGFVMLMAGAVFMLFNTKKI